MEIEKWTMTVGEASKYLGISRPLTYAMVRIGKLPGIRLGRRILIPRKAVEKMMEFPDRYAAFFACLISSSLIFIE